jgi:hypothetical protein
MQEIDRDDEIWRGRVADDFLCTKSLVRVFLSGFRLPASGPLQPFACIQGLKAQGRTWKDDYIKMYVTHKTKVRDAKAKRQVSWGFYSTVVH